MSLDVYLTSEPENHECVCRECGHVHQNSRSVEVYSSNITHNLNKMADAAGIYKHLWRPEEIGITKASQLIHPLLEGLTLLRSDPERFKAYNSKNGWGLYDNFVPFVENYLHACQQYPTANVTVSR